MPYQPGEQFDPARSVQAGQNLVSPLTDALQKYLGENKKKDFNRSNFEALMQSPDARRFLTPEMIAKFPKQNSDAQAGTLSGVLMNVKDDIQRRQEERAARLSAAQTNQAEAKAHQLWTGQGEEAALNLSPEEQAAASKAGVVPLRQSRGSFQYREDPNSPVNMGSQDPVPVPDPRDKTKFIGLKQANGTVKIFPRASSIQEMIDLGYMQKPAGAAPTPAPEASPVATGGGAVEAKSKEEWAALPSGALYKAPDGSVRRKP